MFEIDDSAKNFHTLNEDCSFFSTLDGKNVLEISQDGEDIHVDGEWKSEPGENYVVRLTKI